MSKKSKEHRKKVAARNQRLVNQDTTLNVGNIMKTGMATPQQAFHLGEAYIRAGKNPEKEFKRSLRQRKT